MAGDLETLDYKDLTEEAIRQLQSGLHLQRYKTRRDFVHAICQETREALVACIMGMVLTFIDLYRACIKGKRFAAFQQEWMRSLASTFYSK